MYTELRILDLDTDVKNISTIDIVNTIINNIYSSIV